MVGAVLVHRLRRWPNIKTTLVQRAFDLSQTNTRPWPNAALLLVHRLRRWANIKTALVRPPICAGFGVVRFWRGEKSCCWQLKYDSGELPQQTRDIDPIFVSFRASIADRESTLNQHWLKILCWEKTVNSQVIGILPVDSSLVRLPIIASD